MAKEEFDFRNLEVINPPRKKTPIPYDNCPVILSSDGESYELRINEDYINVRELLYGPSEEVKYDDLSDKSEYENMHATNIRLSDNVFGFALNKFALKVIKKVLTVLGEEDTYGDFEDFEEKRR